MRNSLLRKKKTWYFLHPFRTWYEFFRLSFETFPCRIVSIAYYLSMETFWVERNFIGKNGFPDQLPKLSKKLLAYSRNFSKDCRNGALFVQGIKLTKTSFSEEVCFVYLFQIMSGNFSSFWQKFVNRVVKIAFYVTVGKMRWEIVFFGKKTWYFLHPFGTWYEFFRLLFETFPCRIVTTAYYLPMETFWVDRFFIGKNDSPDQLPKLSEKLLAFRRNFSKVCQNGALFVQRIKLTKTTFSEKICFVYHFQIMSGKISAIWQIFVDRIVKIAFFLRIGKMRWEIVFFGKKTWYFLHPFGTWYEFFRLLFETFPCRIVTTAYYLPMETFWVERFFIGINDSPDQLPKLSEKLLAFRRNFSKVCQNGALFVQRIKLTKTTFSEKICFVYHFQIMSGKISAIWQIEQKPSVLSSKFFQSLSKRRSSCPKDQVNEN